VLYLMPLYTATWAYGYDIDDKRYLWTFCFRFNRCMKMEVMSERLLNAACCCGARPERVLRLAEFLV
jgi:hypothetical protein